MPEIMEVQTDSQTISSEICRCVFGTYPFDVGKAKYVDEIDFCKPGKPEDGSIRYIAYDVNDDKPRMKLKTGRYLTRKCKLQEILTDSELRGLANKINSLLWSEDELTGIDLVIGRAITQAYRDAVGGNSCMVGGCSDYTRLYEVNPDRFSMLIIREGNDSARAIVHKLDNGERYMDRIYTTAENLKDKMFTYADSQGWHYAGVGQKDLQKKDLILSGLNFEDGEIPYMDTMTCGYVKNGKLTISYSGREDYTLASQDGALEGGMCCESCGERVHEDDIYPAGGGYYCEHCFNGIFFYCECCEEPQAAEVQVYIEDKEIYVCVDCARDNYQCEKCSAYYSSDAIFTVGNNCYCEECFEEVAETCDDCKESYLNEDLTTNDDGVWCPDCLSQHIEEAKEATI